MSDFTGAFRFIGDNADLLLRLTGKHLLVSGEAIGIALLIAIPLGVWLGHIHRGSFVAINIGNLFRSLPSLALLAIGIALIGIGVTNVIIALVVLAVPPMLTNAYVAIDGVEPDVVDAARGMGMREREIVMRVEMPLALPFIFAGIRTAALFVVATATITSLAGYSGTLGDIIANQASYRFTGVLGAAICVAVLALVVSGVFAGIQRLVTPRGLRAQSQVGHDLAPAVTVVPATR
ncbi:MAG: glycine betaine/carnitine/choline/choline sulfate ABC transporter permease OpuCB [Thermoleophilaceae bacterium]